MRYLRLGVPTLRPGEDIWRVTVMLADEGGVRMKKGPRIRLASSLVMSLLISRRTPKKHYRETEGHALSCFSHRFGAWVGLARIFWDMSHTFAMVPPEQLRSFFDIGRLWAYVLRTFVLDPFLQQADEPKKRRRVCNAIVRGLSSTFNVPNACFGAGDGTSGPHGYPGKDLFASQGQGGGGAYGGAGGLSWGREETVLRPVILWWWHLG